MLYFLLNTKKTRSNRGYFGYYSLAQWWNTEFTEAEQERFREAYESTHMLIPFDALFQGAEKPLMEYRNKKKSAVGFLSMLLNSIVYTKGNEDISQKFINKCAQLIDTRTNDVDLYFYYLSQIKLYGRLRQGNPSYEMPFRKACQSQVDIL
jgi:hypothetical protein